ncbi:hypothetical protein NDU88_008320 [Pleurodeles waltl]|uniref:Uncharacterized protein n=1 Tax=Pleurodeles waltl TaxID=8319 RepID=A0AAV7RVF3_PLEWA|nr:hypothetical protein NDU88_008320 [Pleurodeles waltl]
MSSIEIATRPRFQTSPKRLLSNRVFSLSSVAVCAEGLSVWCARLPGLSRAGGEGRRWPDRQAGLLFGRFSALGHILAHPHSRLFCHVNPCASSPGLFCSPHPLVLRVLPRAAARSPARPQAGRGPGLPGRHTGRARPVRPPMIAPPVTYTQRLSAIAGPVIARLCSSSTGPFSFLLIRSCSDLIGGPGLHHLTLDTSPESALGFQPCPRLRYVSDFNFTAGPVGSSLSMRPPS